MSAPATLQMLPLVRHFPVCPSPNGLTRGHIRCTALDSRANPHHVKLVVTLEGRIYVEFPTHCAYPARIRQAARIMAFSAPASAREDALMARYLIPLAAWEAAQALAHPTPPNPLTPITSAEVELLHLFYAEVA